MMLALVLLFALSAPPEFVPLGDLPGGAFESGALGVSHDGQVVVGSSESASGREAFRWTAAGSMEPLGELSGGGFASVAHATSADGSVVVGWSWSALGREAFIWTSKSGLVGLSDLPGGNFGSEACVITPDGTVIAGAGTSANHGGLSEAVIWSNGKVRSLVPAGSNVVTRAICGLSSDGTIGSGSAATTRGFEAVMWIDGVGFNPLGSLPGGAFESTGADITPDGRVIVGSSSSSRGTEPFRWSIATGMVGLGDIPGGVSGAGARGVSADGWRIVGQGNDEFGVAAFLWDPIHGTRSLKRVLEDDYGLDLTGWQPKAAEDITDDGQAIVGNGFNDVGDNEAFLARIPPFCYADCDQSTSIGTLDLQDFLCYQQRFLAGDLYSDCNQDGRHNIFDFLCFQDHFFEGCGS